MKITFVEDSELVSKLKEAIKNNDGYCPCALVRTPETKCMCKEFREMEKGICHCGLYQKS